MKYVDPTGHYSVTDTGEPNGVTVSSTTIEAPTETFDGSSIIVAFSEITETTVCYEGACESFTGSASETSQETSDFTDSSTTSTSTITAVLPSKSSPEDLKVLNLIGAGIVTASFAAGAVAYAYFVLPEAVPAGAGIGGMICGPPCAVAGAGLAVTPEVALMGATYYAGAYTVAYNINATPWGAAEQGVGGIYDAAQKFLSDLGL